MNATRLLPLLLASLVTSCMLLPKQATYAYVGQVTTGEPRPVTSLGKKQTEIEVPLNFTGGEWMKSSAISYHHAKATIKGREIQLRIYTDLGQPPSNKSFRIKPKEHSEYDLVFIDPDGTKHPLGKFQR